MPKYTLYLFCFCSVTLAQPVSFGVRGGAPVVGPFSNAFAGATLATGFQTGIQTGTQTTSGSNAYVVGPMIEVRFPLGFSLEGDALYHPLKLVQNMNTTTGVFQNFTTFSSWEFPIVGKYRFVRRPSAKPYVEAGPSFRALASGISDHFSKAGFTVGAGIEFKLSRIRVEPEFRYTRWGSDPTVTGQTASGAVIIPSPAPSNVNQAQFLLGIAF